MAQGSHFPQGIVVHLFARCGNGAIYTYADRLAPTRWFNNIFWANPRVGREFTRSSQAAPRYVVFPKSNYPPLPAWLAERAAHDFAPRYEEMGYVICGLKTTASQAARSLGQARGGLNAGVATLFLGKPL